MGFRSLIKKGMGGVFGSLSNEQLETLAKRKGIFKGVAFKAQSILDSRKKEQETTPTFYSEATGATTTSGIMGNPRNKLFGN